MASAARNVERISADAAQDLTQSGLDMTAESTRRLTDQVTRLFGFSAEGTTDLARQASQNFEAITEASEVLVRGFQDVSREWFSLTQEGLQKNLEELNALAGCRSVSDLMVVQTSLVRENLQQTLDMGRRLAEVSTRVANKASQTTMTVQRRSSLHRAA
jgi:hypothetical protein